MINSRKAGIIESKLIQFILVLVAVAIIITLYIDFKESAAANLKYAMNKIFGFG